MVIGGSSLVGAAMPYSDLDIIFLVPKLAQNPYAECLSSFFDHLRKAIDKEAEFKKFVWFFGHLVLNKKKMHRN
jgi:hypothetical protein